MDPSPTEGVSFSEDHKAAYNEYLRGRTDRKFTTKTWNQYVDYLRDGKDPEAGDPSAQKSSIKRRYYWDWSREELIFKSGNKITVREDRVFDTLAFEYQRAEYRGRKRFWETVYSKYHGITDNDTRRFVADCKKWHSRKTVATHTQNDGDRTFGSRNISISQILNSTDVDGRTESDTIRRFEVGNQNRSDLALNPPSGSEKTKRWIEWLKHMRNREWPKSLECSRYRTIIFGLYTILQAARPANAYFTDGKPPADAFAAPYVSADLLCLSMEQAALELEKSEGITRPILIKHNVTTAKGLLTIEECLENLSWFGTVTVQDSSRRCDESSGIQWETDEAISRFKTESKPPEQQPPINLLDLSCMGLNVIPECFCSKNMQFLARLRPGAGRPVERVDSIWNKAESWHLLGQAGSGTMTHQDHCGFWTWVKIEEGEKLWLICELSDDDREIFAKDILEFTGGRWFYVWLESGDTLIMPPGTVHAVFTPVQTLCTGGNAWSQVRMGDTMKSIYFEEQHPGVTNDDAVAQLPDLLKETSRRMEMPNLTANFGSDEQIKMFCEYYEKYKQICKSPIATKIRITQRNLYKRQKRSAS